MILGIPVEFPRPSGLPYFYCVERLHCLAKCNPRVLTNCCCSFVFRVVGFDMHNLVVVR